MDFNVNLIGVLVAGFVSMIIGSIWYGPLFGKEWMKLSGMTLKKIKAAQKKGMTGEMITAFASSLLMAYVLGVLFKSLALVALIDYLMWSVLVWIGFVSTMLIHPILWEGKPSGLFFLNSSHRLVELLSIAIILFYI